MITTPRNKRVVIGIMVALAVLIFAIDARLPQGWTPAPLYVAVVGASMWLAGLRPIWIAAIACTLLTVLAFFVAPPGWANADLFNRGCSIMAICGIAIFCVLYKRTEQRSLELAAIVKPLGDAIINKSLDGVITTWNVGAARLFGYTAEEVVGKPVSILVPPDHPDECPDSSDESVRAKPWSITKPCAGGRMGTHRRLTHPFPSPRCFRPNRGRYDDSPRYYRSQAG